LQSKRILELEIAKELLKIEAVKLSPAHPFVWASGLRSPIYCDNRLTLSYPNTRNLIKKSLVQLSQSFDTFDSVSGVATAGIAHGALLADGLNKPFSYIRSSAKSHGRQNQIEGVVKPHEKILVVEDLISTGKSSLEAVECLRNAGALVVGVIAIFNYEFPSAIENFDQAQCEFRTLSNYSALLSVALETGYIKSENFDTLKIWKENPEAWSLNHN